jgi:hypothetical protein
VNGGIGAPAGELILFIIHWRPCRSFSVVFAGMRRAGPREKLAPCFFPPVVVSRLYVLTLGKPRKFIDDSFSKWYFFTGLIQEHKKDGTCCLFLIPCIITSYPPPPPYRISKNCSFRQFVSLPVKPFYGFVFMLSLSLLSASPRAQESTPAIPADLTSAADPRPLLALSAADYSHDLFHFCGGRCTQLGRCFQIAGICTECSARGFSGKRSMDTWY